MVKLAKDLGAEKGKIYTHITGEIKIVSKNPYCASCQGVIQQSNEMFPNVKLILIDGAK
ncbi:deaminase domain-containing protein [Capnocytophaga canimorsus]|uniref:deaminase domain-containing protein n=1 Tax=Capnocytophaga canimorsus TaxID=28188 RepID=UPI0037D5FB33